jgi:hypothetical protein
MSRTYRAKVTIWHREAVAEWSDGIMSISNIDMTELYEARVYYESVRQTIGAQPVDYSDLVSRPEIAYHILESCFDSVELIEGDPGPEGNDPPGTVY